MGADHELLELAHVPRPHRGLHSGAQEKEVLFVDIVHCTPQTGVRTTGMATYELPYTSTLVPISSPRPEISLGFKVVIVVSLSMEMTSAVEAWHTTTARC